MLTKVSNAMLNEYTAKPCFRAYHSAQQAVPVGVWTKLLFDTALINVGGFYAGGTSRFTPRPATTKSQPLANS